MYIVLQEWDLTAVRRHILTSHTLRQHIHDKPDISVHIQDSFSTVVIETMRERDSICCIHDSKRDWPIDCISHYALSIYLQSGLTFYRFKLRNQSLDKIRKLVSLSHETQLTVLVISFKHGVVTSMPMWHGMNTL